jgi:hypothetical protein
MVGCRDTGEKQIPHFAKTAKFGMTIFASGEAWKRKKRMGENVKRVRTA